ncbi:MAG TPA: hypothetical protein VLH16_00385, partial [Bacteroidales bacterium]|nr:hypothetical protein [Bacteroidales bacterium]
MFLAIGCGRVEQPAPNSENNISIEVVNNTANIHIAFAVFFGEGLEEGGENHLGEEVISPGETHTFVLPEGTYDLSLLTYELFVVYGSFGISESSRIEIGGPDMLPVLVRNDSDQDIALFYISPSENPDWGEDLLGAAGFIPALSGRRFFFVEPGTYDLLAINLDEQRVLE